MSLWSKTKLDRLDAMRRANQLRAAWRAKALRRGRNRRNHKYTESERFANRLRFDQSKVWLWNCAGYDARAELDADLRILARLTAVTNGI